MFVCFRYISTGSIFYTWLYFSGIPAAETDCHRVTGTNVGRPSRNISGRDMNSSEHDEER